MDTTVILSGLLLFAACIALHIAIWRWGVPWLSSFMLILLLVGIPLLAGLGVMADVAGAGRFLGLSALEAAEVLLLHLSLAGAYLAGYPAVRAVSPSLDILVMISSAPGGNLPREELLRRYAEKRVVTARIDDLVEYRLLVREQELFTVSPLARWIVGLFGLYRRMLGLPAGGG